MRLGSFSYVNGLEFLCSGGACGILTEDPFPLFIGLNVSTDLEGGWYILLPSTRIAGGFFVSRSIARNGLKSKKGEAM